MRQAGRYLPEYRAVRAKVSFLELCKTPDLAAEVTLQPVDILGVDAAILFSDILVLCEAMGMELILEDQGPQFPSPLGTQADVEKLRVPDPEEKLGFVMEAIRRTLKALRSRVPVIGFCGAPWTLAAYMIEGKTSRGFEKAKAAIFSDEKLAHTLLGKITDALIAYLNAQLAAGAHALQIFDSWAGALGPEDYARFGAPYVARLKRDRTEPQPVIVFGVETGELLGSSRRRPRTSSAWTGACRSMKRAGGSDPASRCKEISTPRRSSCLCASRRSALRASSSSPTRRDPGTSSTSGTV